MSLPTWEIVVIVVIALTITAVSIYAFVRCWKSISWMSGEATKRQESSRPRAKNPGTSIPEVYGVPYQPEVVTHQLDAATLQRIVNGSDIHPYYLEKKEHVGGQTDVKDSEFDHKISWRPDEVLIESEFLPASTYAYIGRHATDAPLGTSSVHRPKKVVRINYGKRDDGEPDINCITTDKIESSDSENEDTLDEVFEGVAPLRRVTWPRVTP